MRNPSSGFHTVAETTSFISDARRAGVSDAERVSIIRAVATQPQGGDEVVGSGGVRKLRVAGKGRGKSGGYRVMIAYLGADAPVYLLAMLSKGERDNFSADGIAEMRKLTNELRRYWRERRT